MSAAGDALAQARQVVAEGGELPARPADAVALGWALKQVCYEAWHSEPPAAVRAAEALARLREQRPGQVELAALADWTAGIASLIRGEMAQAVPLFDAAAAGLRAAGQPDPAAQTQVPKIMALSMRGDHAAAVACAEATRRELLALGNVAAAARVSLNLGNLQMLRDAYPQAAQQFRAAAVLFARQGDHVYSVMADIGLGDALCEMGDLDEALRIYARARMRAEHRGLRLQQAQVDEAVAILDLVRGRYRDSLAGFESARRRYEVLGVPQYVAIVEKLLGDAYLELRLLPEALGHFETAVARFRELGLPTEEARALTQRGRALAMLGRKEAAASYAAAAALFAGQQNQVGQADVALASAERSLAAGDGPEAVALAEAASRACVAAEQAAGHARAEVLRGESLLACGDVGAAAAVFEVTLAQAAAMQQLPLQMRSLAGLGLAAMSLGRSDEAVAKLEAAIELFELQRRALPVDEIRRAYLAGHLRAYEARLRIALEAGDAADVLCQLDRFRARALEERLAESVPLAQDEEMLVLRQRLNWLYRRLQRLHDQADDAAVAVQAEVQRTERDLLERVRRQRVAAPAAADGAGVDSSTGIGPGGGVDDDTALSVADLQAALRPGDAIVEFGLQDDELFACVVRPGGVSLVRHLASWAAVQEAARAARFQIESLRNGTVLLERHLQTLAARARIRLQALHRLLWQPLEPALAGSARILVIPHGLLAMVPFCALDDGRGPLGDRVDLSLAPSARAALRGLRRPAAPVRRAVALGESSMLPHAAEEARLVAGLFADGQALVGPQATLAGLQRAAVGADVLHLACHAQFRSDNPRFSALHLADGALTADLAEELPLHAGTVVLSACETAMAEDSPGDEMVGLVRAFLVAGAARVVACLWPVDDAVTYRFMTHFYAALAGGAGPAAAVRLAQARTREDHPHPYFWGAFTVHGGW